MATTKTITKNLGGDRLGSGSKNNISLHNYNRSNHDLSYAWRSSMNCGTLVPFMKILGLNGDTFSIDLNPIVRTIPTIGPLYGAYKLQLDVFECPLRLYNGLLHNNATKIGLKMKQVKIPQITCQTRVNNPNIIEENKSLSQISTSSILHYFGLKGFIDLRPEDWAEDEEYRVTSRNINAIPLLAYWDIVKNYYSNKQEEKAVMITPETEQTTGYYTRLQTREVSPEIYTLDNQQGSVPTGITPILGYKYQPFDNAPVLKTGKAYQLNFIHEIYPETLYCVIYGTPNTLVAITDVFSGDAVNNNMVYLGAAQEEYIGNKIMGIYYKPVSTNVSSTKLVSFPLENIDKAREEILKSTGLNQSVDWDDLEEYPYKKTVQLDDLYYNNNKYPQNGLALKTYQSDLLQNWLQTEWIDGENGINAITAVDTSSGSFQIDALNLANKVYNMLNRIAVSGGTYEDWQEAVYSTEVVRRAETPIYKGGMAAEIVFEEVVSTAAAGDDPLGTLAGKGRTAAERGGHIEIKCDEPCYIIGIVSITPRIDYSQGNDWDMVELRSMDDLHKPALDGIGFEDLLQERAAWWGTYTDGARTHKLAMGKTPAWINYMTNINQSHGDFAEEEKRMWMTLNRRYEYDKDTAGIADVTTYIDPSKFNYTFADSSLEAQNFWVQIGISCMARRVMSAKILPNL